MILSILNELANEPSRNAKIAIMQREKGNQLLQDVIKLALDPYLTFGIKAIPKYKCVAPSTTTLSQALSKLEAFSSRRCTGNNAIAYLVEILESLSTSDAEVIERVIGRDLKCGVATSPNEVWPGIVPSFDVMLCGKDINKIKFEPYAYSECKSDGARIHLHFDGVECQAFTRSGKTVPLFGVFDQAANAVMKKGETWDGELVCVDAAGKIIDRKTGNGIINQLLKGKGSLATASQLRMITWDIIDFTSTIPYCKRWEELETRLVYPQQLIRLVECKIVRSYEEAMAHYNDLRSRGEEGSILKNFDHKWEAKRSSQLCKLKAVEDIDLEVIGLEEGTGKNVGRLGALVCRSKDGTIEVNVGTGFSDHDRDALWANKPIGKIAELQYNEIISKKGSTTKSLFLPVFVCIRDSWDKVEGA